MEGWLVWALLHRIAVEKNNDEFPSFTTFHLLAPLFFGGHERQSTRAAKANFAPSFVPTARLAPPLN